MIFPGCSSRSGFSSAPWSDARTRRTPRASPGAKEGRGPRLPPPPVRLRADDLAARRPPHSVEAEVGEDERRPLALCGVGPAGAGPAHAARLEDVREVGREPKLQPDAERREG